jgi:hypothetical protein
MTSSTQLLENLSPEKKELLRKLVAEKQLRKDLNPDNSRAARNWIEKYAYIQTKKQNIELIKFNKAQDEYQKIVEALTAAGLPVRICVLKARQLGISTITQCNHSYSGTQFANKRCKTISYSGESAADLFDMSERIYRLLPEDKKPPIRYHTKSKLVFLDKENKDESLDSRIIIDTAKNLYSGRSQTIHNLHISEMGMMSNVSSLLISLMNAVADEPNTFSCVESTAMGADNFFKEFWDSCSTLEEVLSGNVDTDAGKRDYVKLFIPWYWGEEYVRTPPKSFKLFNYEHERFGNEKELEKSYHWTKEQFAYRRWAIVNMCNGDIEIFHQEYPSNEIEAFIAGGRMRFDKPSVVWYVNNYKDPIATGELYAAETEEQAKEHFGRYEPEIIFEKNPTGLLELWEYPDSECDYVIGGDVAEGIEIVPGDSRKTDYSVGSVFKRSPYKKVAQLRGKIEPDVFADYLRLLGWYYNLAWICCEANKEGVYVNKLLDERYSYVYYQLILDEKTERKTRKVGWHTNSATRPVMIGDLAKVIRERSMINESYDSAQEYMNFIIGKRGKAEAKYGTNDDVVFADGLALEAHMLMPIVSRVRKNINKKVFGYRRHKKK